MTRGWPCWVEPNMSDPWGCTPMMNALEGVTPVHWMCAKLIQGSGGGFGKGRPTFLQALADHPMTELEKEEDEADGGVGGNNSDGGDDDDDGDDDGMVADTAPPPPAPEPVTPTVAGAFGDNDDIESSLTPAAGASSPGRGGVVVFDENPASIAEGEEGEGEDSEELSEEEAAAKEAAAAAAAEAAAAAAAAAAKEAAAAAERERKTADEAAEAAAARDAIDRERRERQERLQAERERRNEARRAVQAQELELRRAHEARVAAAADWHAKNAPGSRGAGDEQYVAELQKRLESASLMKVRKLMKRVLKMSQDEIQDLRQLRQNHELSVVQESCITSRVVRTRTFIFILLYSFA